MPILRAMPTDQPRVRAVSCDHRASEEEIYNALRRATDPLHRSWERLARARRIVLKLNMMKLPERVTWFEGRRRELVDDAVCRAVLRLLRERTSAELVATDTNFYTQEHLMGDAFNYARHLRDFGVRFVDANLPPFCVYEVPRGGSMFARYTLTSCLEGAEVVSVSKMKDHRFTGITLCAKNLFGLPPISPPQGRTRIYFHHFVRLPHVLADLAAIMDPCLNIVDALTVQIGAEWDGEGRIANALVAGEQITATDASCTRLMGHDPEAEYPVVPFVRDRNHLAIAARAGLGTVRGPDIDFQSEVAAPLAPFGPTVLDPPRVVRRWLETTCRQALHYREHRREIVDRCAGEFVFLQAGEVVWHGQSPDQLPSRRVLSGDRSDEGLWLKLVDPDEREGEHFEAYDQTLRLLDTLLPPV